jgi:hypothetical protein
MSSMLILVSFFLNKIRTQFWIQFINVKVDFHFDFDLVFK